MLKHKNTIWISYKQAYYKAKYLRRFETMDEYLYITRKKIT